MTDAESRSSDSRQSDVEEWRGIVRKALNCQDLSALSSRTRDGIVVEPLYGARTDTAPIAGRGARPWTVVQIVDDEDPDAANRQALADLNGGATGLSLRLAGAPSAGGAGLSADPGALQIALEGVDLTAVHLRLEPHPDALAAAQWLAGLVERSGTAPELTDIAFGLDPIAVLASDGNGAAPEPEAFAARFRDLSSARFRGPLVTLDARPFHEAGATEAQELASVLAAAAWWLRALDGAGIAPAESLSPIGAGLAMDQEQFLGIAKLRALRLLWARLQELCRVKPTPLAIHADTSRRMLTRADPTTNLLRTTVAALSAAVGGADTITVLPHTSALGRPDSNARALARNIQHLLIEEAQVHRVADAAGGSGVIEALTDALAERAWAEFQTIEREGGIVASLLAGAFAKRVGAARSALEGEVAGGALPLVGATIHPAPEEAPPAAPGTEHAGLARLGLAPVRLEDCAKAAA